jgi:hypothetical protein
MLRCSRDRQKIPCWLRPCVCGAAVLFLFLSVGIPSYFSPCRSETASGIVSIDLQYKRQGGRYWHPAITIVEDRRIQENIDDIRIGKVVRYIEKRWGTVSLRLWVREVGEDGGVQFYSIPLSVSGE